ncbi:hypothetical protein MCEMSE15_00672 [Fimbriimonadaceae bacterium]
MRLNQRGSLFTGRLGNKSERRRIRRATFYVLFTLSICAGMIMVTQDYASLRIGVEVHTAAIFFLAILPWLVFGASRRFPRSLEGPFLATLIGFGCLILGKVFLSSNAANNSTAQLRKLKTLSQATLVYASDHSETLPPANVWMDSISNRVTEEDFTLGKNLMPAQDGYHVAMNSNLSQKSLAKLESPDDSILYFLSIKSKRNANDAFHSTTEMRRGVNLSGNIQRVPEPTSSKP